MPEMSYYNAAASPSPASPDMLSLEEIREQANACLARDEFEAAYPLVARLAGDRSADAETCSTAGVLAATLGLSGDARRHFSRALELDPGHYNARSNLAVLALQDNRSEEALEILRELVEYYPDRADAHNDLGVAAASLNDTPMAEASYRRALAINPGHANAAANLAALTSTGAGDYCEEPAPVATEQSGRPVAGKRLVFFANHDSFLGDILDHLGRDNDVRFFLRPSRERMRREMQSADLAWFEWCDSLLIEAASMPRACPVVCRLHSYEAFTAMPSKVDWRKVDHLVFVNRSVQELFERQVRCATPRTVILNGVDTSRFTIPAGKSAGKKIAAVGYINYKKNPMLLLYALKKIYEHDPGYSLHIAGEFQDSRIQLYVEHFLRHNPLPVSFDGWVDDMPAWYADKDYVISTSLFESFHYSIAEGMASGLLPLIHNWFGADNLYPAEYLFADPDDCLRLLQRLEQADQDGLRRKNREYIAGKFSQTRSNAAISTLLGSITAPAHMQNSTDRIVP